MTQQVPAGADASMLEPLDQPARRRFPKHHERYSNWVGDDLMVPRTRSKRNRTCRPLITFLEAANLLNAAAPYAIQDRSARRSSTARKHTKAPASNVTVIAEIAHNNFIFVNLDGPNRIPTCLNWTAGILRCTVVPRCRCTSHPGKRSEGQVPTNDGKSAVLPGHRDRRIVSR